MELVYLWVEDYKNIHKQGFNFSPRFECDYHDGILDIKDKEEAKEPYLKDFFGEKINVTAIVGENGSGKSNILESILCLIYKNGTPWDYYKLAAIFYNEQDNTYHQKSINHNICYINDISTFSTDINHLETFAFHYNYSLDYIKNEENNINFNKFYHKTDNYKTPILLQPNKSDYSINTRTMDYLANQDILNFIIHKKISFSNIKTFFEVTQCKLDFHYSYIYGTEDVKKDNSLFLYMKNLSLNEGLNIFDTRPDYGLEDFSDRLAYITRDGLILLTKLYILKKAIKNKK